MSDEVFAFQIDIPFEEQIEFLTIVSASESGLEQRFQKWQRPKRSFRLRLDARNATEMKDVWTFYQRHKGAFDSFLFQNPNENPVDDEVFGSGDGSQTVFYLGRDVDVGTGDLIVTPASAAVERSIGGTGDFLSFTDFTIDEDIGQITMNSAPAAVDVFRADYNFRYRVRFKEDNLTREAFASELWRYGLELVEVI